MATTNSVASIGAAGGDSHAVPDRSSEPFEVRAAAGVRWRLESVPRCRTTDRGGVAPGNQVFGASACAGAAERAASGANREMPPIATAANRSARLRWDIG